MVAHEAVNEILEFRIMNGLGDVRIASGIERLVVKVCRIVSGYCDYRHIAQLGQLSNLTRCG